MAFREVCYLGGPVIHLDVYIDVVIGVPGGFDVFVPDSLEVGGHAAGP